MSNVSEFEITGMDGKVKTYVLVDHGNNEFTSILKEYWDEQQAAAAAALASAPL